MADPAVPEMTDNSYRQLYALSIGDAPSRAQAIQVVQSLTPAERTAFYDHINRQTSAQNKDLQSQATVLGVPDRARPDTNVIGTPSGEGISPEMLLGGVSAGRNIVSAMRGPGGVVAGAKAGAQTVNPLVKFEFVRRSARAMGLSDNMATLVAYGVVHFTGGSAPAPKGPGGATPDPTIESDLASGKPMGAADTLARLKTLPPEAQRAAFPRADVPGVALERETLPPPSQLAPKVTEPMPASAPPLGTTPPPAPSPGPNNVQPPAAPQPPPPTTPANTPPRAASPKVQAAAQTISGWTPAEYNAVKDLPVDQRVAYLRMRQGGYAADDAMATVQQMQKAEQAQTARAMVGSDKAAAELFPNLKPAAARQRLLDMAPGPSRKPLAGDVSGLDARFKGILSDPRIASLLRGGGLGDLATRGAP